MEGTQTRVQTSTGVGSTCVPDRTMDQFQPSSLEPNSPDRILAALGVKLVDAAGALKAKTATPGTFSGAADAIAQALEQAGFYLQGRAATDLLDKSADLIRRHPGPALLIGAAIGFLAARTIRR